MTFTDYQAAAARTMAPTTGIRSEDRHARLILALGLVGEAGEVADLVKKIEGHGHALDVGKLDEELGDLLWYVAATATAYGRSLNVIAAGNEAKLRRRYPNGFSEAASRDRAVTQ